ncbi:hypothetical protein AAVH_37104 [Aphelenchoides avenae]|nr:hypothetical protein AAVH_37104 [Aphelenchus avenae]
MTRFQDHPADRELRSEVEDLRSEIGSLRDQLNQQIQFFTEERRRWETERGNVMHASPGSDASSNGNNNNSNPSMTSSIVYGSTSLYRPPEKRNAVAMSKDRLI